MTKVVQINGRGMITVPKEFRERLGIKGEGHLVVEETAQGLLLRPGVTVPVEIYSDERLAEFARANEEALAEFDLKQQ